MNKSIGVKAVGDMRGAGLSVSELRTSEEPVYGVGATLAKQPQEASDCSAVKSNFPGKMLLDDESFVSQLRAVYGAK